MHSCYNRTIREGKIILPSQDKLYKKKIIIYPSHKNNCGQQVPSRNFNEKYTKCTCFHRSQMNKTQNDNHSRLKQKFPGFLHAKHKQIVSKNPNHTPGLLTNI